MTIWNFPKMRGRSVVGCQYSCFLQWCQIILLSLLFRYDTKNSRESWL